MPRGNRAESYRGHDDRLSEPSSDGLPMSQLQFVGGPRGYCAAGSCQGTIMKLAVPKNGNWFACNTCGSVTNKPASRKILKFLKKNI